MRILCYKTTVYIQNEYADSLSNHFVKTFCLIYGRGNVSYNVHSLIHLSQDTPYSGSMYVVPMFVISISATGVLLLTGSDARFTMTGNNRLTRRGSSSDVWSRS